MLRKLLAVIVVLGICVGIVVPANAAELKAIEQANAIQERAAVIDELITIASEAWRSGEDELAERYESMLSSYGVKSLVTNDPREAEAYFGLRSDGSDVMPCDIPEMESTNAIKWYSMEYNDYYHYLNGKYYNLVCLYAKPINAIPSGLFYEDITVENPNAVSFETALIDNVSEALAEDMVSFAAGEIAGLIPSVDFVVDSVVTLGDVVSKATLESQEYKTIRINPGSMACHWDVQVTACYWYVKRSGTAADYGLYCAENKISFNTVSSVYVAYVKDDGTFTTRPAVDITLENEYRAEGYNYLAKMVEAFEESAYRHDSVGPVWVYFRDQAVKVEDFEVPLYPQYVS